MLKMEKIVYQADICLFNELLTFESCMYNADKCGRYLRKPFA